MFWDILPAAREPKTGLNSSERNWRPNCPSAQGIEAAQARVGARTFGAVVEELLGMDIV